MNLEFKKLANALFEDAKPNIENQKTNSLWVGGTVELKNSVITFTSNNLNSNLHSGKIDFSIPLRSLEKVSWGFGFLTGIVSLHLKDRTAKFRCFGARKIVNSLNKQLNSHN